jgi:hypothetical protein
MTQNRRPIQNLDLATFQLRIAEVLTELTGKQYSVEFMSINFEPRNKKFFKDRAELELRLETNGWVFYSNEDSTNCDKKNPSDVRLTQSESTRELYKISLYLVEGVETVVDEIPSYDKAVAIREQIYAERELGDYSEYVIERC